MWHNKVKCLKHCFLIAKQLLWLLTSSCFVRSYVYSLHAHYSVKNIVFKFWKVNINISCINISRQMLWQIRAFYEMADMDNRVTSVIQTYQQRLYSKPYVPCSTFGRATLGADSVANKLFIVFLFSDPDVGVQFLKNVGLIQSSMMCCKCSSQMSWYVNASCNDGYRWRCRGKTSASVCSACTSISRRLKQVRSVAPHAT
jgi:hypothetical protein